MTYHDPTSLYSVLRVAPERGYDDPESASPFLSSRVAAVGEIERPAAGQRVRLSGRWTTHRTHGRQFAFDGYEVLAPLGPEKAIQYLSSDAFEGIGEKLAQLQGRS